MFTENIFILNYNIFDSYFDTTLLVLAAAGIHPNE